LHALDSQHAHCAIIRDAVKTAIRTLILGFGIALASTPVAIILTFVVTPFWSWLEATTGIESIGHSGPAAWCYIATALLVLLVIAVSLFFLKRRQQNRDGNQEAA
jgi:H+/Cl- antiporter ClcA